MLLRVASHTEARTQSERSILLGIVLDVWGIRHSLGVSESGPKQIIIQGNPGH